MAIYMCISSAFTFKDFHYKIIIYLKVTIQSFPYMYLKPSAKLLINIDSLTNQSINQSIIDLKFAYLLCSISDIFFHQTETCQYHVDSQLHIYNCKNDTC